MTDRVVLAYSGGLDTSVGIGWIAEETGAEVIAVAVIEIAQVVGITDAMAMRVDPGSRTTNLSFGERPVCGAVRATNGPISANSPSFRRAAACISSGAMRFQ